MAQQANPGLYVDTSTNADQQQNARRLSTWAQSVSPSIYTCNDPIVGVLPMPAFPQDAYAMWAGSPLVAFSAGFGIFIFPVPFPNGILAATVNLVSVGSGTNSIEVLNTTTTAQLKVFASNSGSGPFNGAFHISAIVIGW